MAVEETGGAPNPGSVGKRIGEGMPPGVQGNKHRLKLLPLALLVPKEKF
jgi:hypothetical protein